MDTIRKILDKLGLLNKLPDTVIYWMPLIEEDLYKLIPNVKIAANYKVIENIIIFHLYPTHYKIKIKAKWHILKAVHQMNMDLICFYSKKEQDGKN